MNLIKVNGSLTIELKNKFYTVYSDIYYYDEHSQYKKDTNVIFNDVLYKTKRPCKGKTPVEGDDYSLVKAVDEISDYARLDQAVKYEDLVNFVKKNDLDTYATKDEVRKNYVAKINNDINIFVGKNDGNDETGDGSPEKPFRTFQRALDYLYDIDANHRAVTINLAQGLDESGKLYKLQQVNCRYGIVSVKGVGRDEIKLGQLYVTSGKWFFDNVTFTGTNVGDHVLEVCDQGHVDLARVKFKLQGAKETTDCIKIHNGGIVVLSGGGHLEFTNTTNTRARSAIHTRSGGLFSGGMDFTFNESMKAKIDVVGTNGSFKTAFIADHVSSVAYLDNVTVTVGNGIKQYDVKESSSIDGVEQISGGDAGSSEKVKDSIIANIPIAKLADRIYSKDEILTWFKLQENELKSAISENRSFILRFDNFNIPLQYVNFESTHQLKCVTVGIDHTSFKISKYEIIMNLDQTIVSDNTNVKATITQLGA